jgi:hypothetical protein
MTEFFVRSRQLTIKDEIKNISIPILVHYPTNEISRPVSFGPYVMDVSPDAEIIDSEFPLIIISQGNKFTSFVQNNNGKHLSISIINYDLWITHQSFIF